MTRNTIPLVVAAAVILAAIVSYEKPFSGGESSEESGEQVVAPDAPTRPDQPERGPAVAEEELAASLVTPGTEDKAPAATLPEEATVPPTPESEGTTPTPAPEPEVEDGGSAGEFVGIEAWINSQPLKIGNLRGKVVLVDFWTYTCVNCIRTFPYLKVWHAKYADDGLLIVGVHTPEFEFEKKIENVHTAVKDNGIGWAVAMDNDHATSNAYANRYLPSKYLIDQDGEIRYRRFGEGAYAETESEIRKLLEEAGADLSQLDANLPGDQSLDQSFLRDPSAEFTRELYAGWRPGYNDFSYGFGGYVGNQEYYYGIPRSAWDDREAARDAVIAYEDPGGPVKHAIYLQGPWYNGEESLRHARQTSNFEDYMRLIFAAKSVNAVIGAEGEGAGPFKVLVTLDREFLTESNKGADVVIEADGRSFLFVDEPRMYSIIQAPVYSTYRLRLSSNSPNFAVFAFTFGVYESGV